ncbi:MAG: DUF1893 domain-containing protein [Dehalococcoidia bacterium]
MKNDILQELSSSGHKLRIYNQNYTLIYHSNMDRLKPLLEYLNLYANKYTNIIVADRIMGNAAALLSIKAGCKEIYSPLGSQIAEESMKQYGIPYLFTSVVPYIAQPGTTTMCPMEMLSIGKSPDEFFELVNTTVT